MKRLPYRVTVRRMANGCDYSCVLYLRSDQDAFAAMAWRVRAVYGIPKVQLRLVECVRV